jgi:hypothetical protein
MILDGQGGLGIGSEDRRVDSVGDDVTRRLLLDPRPGSTYHLAAGSAAPTAQQILVELLPAAHGEVEFVSYRRFCEEMDSQRRRRPWAGPLYEELAAFMPYLAYPKLFDTSSTMRHLGNRLAQSELDRLSAPQIESALA